MVYTVLYDDDIDWGSNGENCNNALVAWLQQEHNDHDRLTKQDKEAVQDLMAFKERYKNGK